MIPVANTSTGDHPLSGLFLPAPIPFLPSFPKSLALSKLNFQSRSWLTCSAHWLSTQSSPMVGMVAGVKVSCTYRNSMVLLPTFVPPTSTTLKNSSLDMSSSYAPSMLWGRMTITLAHARRTCTTTSCMSVHATWTSFFPHKVRFPFHH